MKTIANQSSLWAGDSSPLDFSDGPEKFGGGAVAPQVAKPNAFFGLFQSEAMLPRIQQRSHEEWIDIGAAPFLPPNSRFPVVLEIVSKGRGPIIPLDVDEVDLELIDLGSLEALAPVDGDSMLEWSSLEANAIGLCPPLESHTISASVGEVYEGKPRAIAMDGLDWELLEEWPQESVHPQVPTVQTKAIISSVSWGQPSVTEVDDADIYLFDE